MADTGTSLTDRLLTWLYPNRGWWGPAATGETATAEPGQPVPNPEGATPSLQERK